jgi:hypothetical protein
MQAKLQLAMPVKVVVPDPKYMRKPQVIDLK